MQDDEVMKIQSNTEALQATFESYHLFSIFVFTF